MVFVYFGYFEGYMDGVDLLKLEGYLRTSRLHYQLLYSPSQSTGVLSLRQLWFN